MELGLVIGLVVLIFAVSTAVVLLQDRRASRRAAERRRARLARLGEVDVSTPSRLHVDR
ncbi:hypothetical protein [Amycolatopsis nigrescens]|uniref:hypothetical protein n=1 Tax=Amycolatopsis nigrescens TaxID=381445 RepID=UPI00146CB1B7|nr:hypothetical protein [Amycolatopsis nigrescens]